MKPEIVSDRNYLTAASDGFGTGSRALSLTFIRPSLHPGGLRSILPVCLSVISCLPDCGVSKKEPPCGKSLIFHPGDEGASGLSFQGFQWLHPGGPPPTSGDSRDGRDPAIVQAWLWRRHDFWWVIPIRVGIFWEDPRRLWPEAPRRRWSGHREGVLPNRASRLRRKERCRYLKDGGCGHLGAFGRARVAFGTVEAQGSRPWPAGSEGPVRGV